MDAEYMEDIALDDKKEHHWRMVFKDKKRGRYDEKAFLHSKRWDI